MSRFALDTNVLIYLHDSNESNKRQAASKLITETPVISSQVISEYLNVCTKRLKINKQDALHSLMSWLPYCTLESVVPNTFSEALRLIAKYQFQMFDAIIVASALIGNCKLLYSEDMQHNLLVDKKLRIINPFI